MQRSLAAVAPAHIAPLQLWYALLDGNIVPALLGLPRIIALQVSVSRGRIARTTAAIYLNLVEHSLRCPEVIQLLVHAGPLASEWHIERAHSVYYRALGAVDMSTLTNEDFASVATSASIGRLAEKALRQALHLGDRRPREERVGPMYAASRRNRATVGELEHLFTGMLNATEGQPLPEGVRSVPWKPQGLQSMCAFVQEYRSYCMRKQGE